MPVKLKVYLKPEKPIKSSLLTPEAVHGLFFNLLSEEFAEELHRPSKVKPFFPVVSSILRRGKGT
ncbi:hypothetical protein [Aquifex aeolicus]|uniref:hypothetical protein n=1 Tax=Aquifex aeolicus TaxID=63363 RepID=UPI00030ABF7A|nr:hypothetical protein [Aquifex aeolicus]